MHIYTTKVNIGICFSVPISYLDRDAVRYWSTHFFAKAFRVYASEMLF